MCTFMILGEIVSSLLSISSSLHHLSEISAVKIVKLLQAFILIPVRYAGHSGIVHRKAASLSMGIAVVPITYTHLQLKGKNSSL